MGSRPRGVRLRRDDDQLGQDLSVCLPANSHDPQGTGQALEVQSMQAHVDCTPLATPTLVSSSDVPDVSGAVLPPSEEGSDPESRQDCHLPLTTIKTLNLAVWQLSSSPTQRQAFLQRLQPWQERQGVLQSEGLIMSASGSTKDGVRTTKSLLIQPLWEQ